MISCSVVPPVGGWYSVLKVRVRWPDKLEFIILPYPQFLVQKLNISNHQFQKSISTLTYHIRSA